MFRGGVWWDKESRAEKSAKLFRKIYAAFEKLLVLTGVTSSPSNHPGCVSKEELSITNVWEFTFFRRRITCYRVQKLHVYVNARNDFLCQDRNKNLST